MPPAFGLLTRTFTNRHKARTTRRKSLTPEGVSYGFVEVVLLSRAARIAGNAFNAASSPAC